MAKKVLTKPEKDVTKKAKKPSQITPGTGMIPFGNQEESEKGEKVDHNQKQVERLLPIKKIDYKESFFLQLHQGNILSIFSRAAILPSKYIPNRPFPDIQSERPEFLLLSKGIIDIIKDTDVLVEVYLDDSELNFDENQNESIWLEHPIPISRIKSINVEAEATKRKIIADATVGNAGIIPERLFKVGSFEGIRIVKINETGVPLSVKNIDKHIIDFDKILGAIAFNKNTSLLFANKNGELSNYNDHYLGMMIALSDLRISEISVKPEVISNFQQLFDIENTKGNAIHDWLFERVKERKNFLDDDTIDFEKIFLPTLPNEFLKKEARKIFKMLTSSIERRKVPSMLRDVNEKEFSYLTVFTFLRMYGNLNSDDRTISRKEIPLFVSKNYAAFIFSLLGYFYGYTHLLNNDEKISSNNSQFETAIKSIGPLTIKFSLSNKLDYFLIEAVYQLVLNKVRLSSESPFLSRLSLPAHNKFNKAELHQEFEVTEMNIFDTQLFKMSKKKLVDEMIKPVANNSLEALKKVPELIPIASDLGLFCMRNKVDFQLMSTAILFSNEASIIEKAKYFISFKKDSLIKLLDANKINLEELVFRIDLSYKNKDF